MTPTRARLARQLGASLRSAAGLVARVHHGERGASGITGAPLLVPTKVYGEAALLLRAARGVPSTTTGAVAIAPARDLLAEALTNALADAEGVWQAVLAPGGRWDHLFPLLLVPGPWSAPARDLARATGSPSWAGVPERLERAWLRAVSIDGPAAPDHVTALVRASHLAGDLDLLHGNLSEAYAFTHAVLHATDQGRWRVPLESQVAGRARALLATALLADNDDVAAELLWTWPLLGLPTDPAAAAVQDLLATGVDRLGFLPGPTWDPGRDEAQGTASSGDRELYRLQTSYHTTLAWGLTCAAELRRGAVAVDTEPPTAADPLPLLDGLPGRWAAAASSATEAERRAAAPLALAAALRHAAFRGDLPQVQALLGWAVQAGLEAEPMVVQAARWLRSVADTVRASTPSDALVNSS